MTKNNDPKAIFESLVFERKKELSNQLQNYISFGVSRADHYENQRRIFLELNLTIMVILGAISSIFFNFLDDKGKLFIVTILISFSVLTIFNIIFNLEEHPTKEFSNLTRYDKFIKKIFRCKDIDDILEEEEGWNTLWFYRGNITKQKDFEGLKNFAIDRFKGKPIESSKKDLRDELIRDDIKDLYKSYYYQANYYRLGLWTRNITIYSILYLIIIAIISSIIILIISI